MLWWRIELDKSGAVLKCDEVDAVSKGSVLVAYVKAATRADALANARTFHEKRKARQRAASAKLAKKRRSAGLCRTCDTPVCQSSINLCQKHFDKQRESRRRFLKGESKPRVPMDPLVLKARENEYQRAYQQRRRQQSAQLPMLLATYDNIDGMPSPFRSWLANEIAERERDDVSDD